MNRQILADKFGITAHHQSPITNHQSPIFSIEFGRFSAKWSKAMCLELAKIFLEKISWLLSKWQWNVV
ncbi:hypothetical protein [Acinetobacter sp.]|uniref:hypothetical protein n=1 Tax=Acinetobacter sp. TaxID=472 RepID=UPI00258DE2B1|nr:hypothetical protein [Acinetobacter sp.]